MEHSAETTTDALVTEFSPLLINPHFSEGVEENTSVQDSSGVLNEIPEETSPQVATTTQETAPAPSPYRTIGRSLEVIEIDLIQRFELIPDYEEQMDSEHPYVLMTPEGNYCLDGQEMIDEAKLQNLPSMLCDIEIIDNHSTAELILRKLASRVRTRGGNGLYPEIIRNTKLAADFLMCSDEKLVFLGHGGRRYGEGFTQDRDSNVRQILSTRLGKDRNTINTHLLHGQHITHDTFTVLIEHRVSKDFFEKYHRSRKRKIQGQLEKEKLPHTEITSRISADILSFLEEYERSKNEERTEHNQSETTEQQEQNDTQESVVAAETTVHDEDEDDVHSNAVNISGQITEPVNDEDEDDEEVTVPAIKQSVKRSAKRIEEAANEDVDANKLAELLRQEMMRLQRILNRLNVLRNESTMSRT